MKYFIIRFLIILPNNPLKLKRKLSEVRKIKKSVRLGVKSVVKLVNYIGCALVTCQMRQKY